MWEQLNLASFLQEHWADNQVSCTVTFDREQEGSQIEHALVRHSDPRRMNSLFVFNVPNHSVCSFFTVGSVAHDQPIVFSFSFPELLPVPIEGCELLTKRQSRLSANAVRRMQRRDISFYDEEDLRSEIEVPIYQHTALSGQYR
tara:strand:+ start:1096 stop:1527 length:432 start_codon:yes stop_codon:yes gene_type:complete